MISAPRFALGLLLTELDCLSAVVGQGNTQWPIIKCVKMSVTLHFGKTGVSGDGLPGVWTENDTLWW
jgi:hypothetical protein